MKLIIKETKIGIDIIGKKAKYIKMSKVKGEQYFKDNGFKQQLNKNYWKKENTYIHYNIIDKTWHIEGEFKPKPIETKIPKELESLKKEALKKGRETIKNRVLNKRIRLRNGSILTYKEAIDKGIFIKAEVARIPSVRWNRRRYNRMTGVEQEEYDKKLEKKKDEYRLYLKDNSFWNVLKLVYEYAQEHIIQAHTENRVQPKILKELECK